MRSTLFAGLIVLAGTAAPSFADEFSGFRMGLGVSEDRVDSTVTDLYTDDVSTTRLGYQLFGGWALNKYLAVEVGYLNGSQFDSIIENHGAPSNIYNRMHTSMNSFAGSVVGAFWFNPKVSLYGRAGMSHWSATAKMINFIPSTTVGVPSTVLVSNSYDRSGDDPFFGVGFQTQLDGALVRFEYQQLDLGNIAEPTGPRFNDTKINTMSFSIVWVLH